MKILWRVLRREVNTSKRIRYTRKDKNLSERKYWNIEHDLQRSNLCMCVCLSNKTKQNRQTYFKVKKKEISLYGAHFSDWSMKHSSKAVKFFLKRRKEKAKSFTKPLKSGSIRFYNNRVQGEIQWTAFSRISRRWE